MAKRTLTIAGSDSGGGAGIQADLKTFNSLGTYGLSVITALTSQNTLGVDGVNAPPPAFVGQQMRAVITDIGVDALKTGMLHSAATVQTVAETLVSLYPTPSNRPAIVVDPVMVSTSGHELLSASAENALCTLLLPIATLVTPNVEEAVILAGWKKSARTIESLEDVKEACVDISKWGCANVLIKGGHLSAGDKVIDVLYEAESREFTYVEHARVRTNNTHGTGCTLSAATTSFLAKGYSVPEAVKASIEYVHTAMCTSLDIGKGPGPLDHCHNIIPRTLPLPNAYNPYPFTSYLIDSCKDLWKTFTQTHPFVLGIQDGTLPRECFIHFLKQDYIFLKHYARIHALAAFKSDSMEDIDAATDIVKYITRESQMHIQTCKSWGISEADFHSTEESNHTVAYTRYVIDIGLTSSLLHLRVATSPCLLGYGELGRLLYAEPKTKREGNPYWHWIETYNGENFQQAVNIGRDLLEGLVRDDPLSPKGLKELADIFRKAVRLEIGFWQMGWDRS